MLAVIVMCASSFIALASSPTVVYPGIIVALTRQIGSKVVKCSPYVCGVAVSSLQARSDTFFSGQKHLTQ